eukprot:gene682-1820_t
MGREKKKKDSENVRVVVRVRPILTFELENGQKNAVELNLGEDEVMVRDQMSHTGGEPRSWLFDSVYNNTFSQYEVYKSEGEPLLDYTLQGYNSTIFAYGQSGSGKTYTINGHDDTDPGILPNLVRDLFKKTKEVMAQEKNKTFTMRLQFIELYNGTLMDLLSEGQTQHLEMRTNGNAFDVPKATTIVLNNAEESLALFHKGNAKRHTASHKLNDRSSRSHTLFILKVEQIDMENPDIPKRLLSKLNLVDLAGSERQGKTGADGKTFAEGAKINGSLLALGCCIDAIIKGEFVMYRSDKLTMLLKDSLGGNSKVNVERLTLMDLT